MSQFLETLKKVAPASHAKPGTSPAPLPYSPTDPRPRTLWRALCASAEPLLCRDEDWRPGLVPRSILLEFQKRVAIGLVGWGVTLREYNAAESPDERVAILRAALAEVGIYLARSNYPDAASTEAAKSDALKTFGRSLMAGAFFIDIALSEMGISIEKLDAQPFQIDRVFVDVDAATAARLGPVIDKAVSVLSGFRLAPLVALQCATVARPASALLVVIPKGAAGGAYQSLVEYVVQQIEVVAEDTARASIALGVELRAGRIEAAQALLGRAGVLKREIAGVSSVISVADPNDSLGVRVAGARNRVCHALACSAAQACSTKIIEAANAPGWRAEMVDALRPLVVLLRSSTSVARDPGDKTTVARIMAETKASLKAAGVGLRAQSLGNLLSMLEPGA